jgi:hypothetical protein
MPTWVRAGCAKRRANEINTTLRLAEGIAQQETTSHVGVKEV